MADEIFERQVLEVTDREYKTTLQKIMESLKRQEEKLLETQRYLADFITEDLELYCEERIINYFRSLQAKGYLEAHDFINRKSVEAKQVIKTSDNPLNDANKYRIDCSDYFKLHKLPGFRTD